MSTALILHHRVIYPLTYFSLNGKENVDLPKKKIAWDNSKECCGSKYPSSTVCACACGRCTMIVQFACVRAPQFMCSQVFAKWRGGGDKPPRKRQHCVRVHAQHRTAYVCTFRVRICYTHWRYLTAVSNTHIAYESTHALASRRQ